MKRNPFEIEKKAGPAPAILVQGEKLVLTRAAMKAAEAAADAAGTSYEQLMENAGAAAAAEIEKLAGGPVGVLLLCGAGNNAGDAFVIGRLLAEKGIAVSWIDVTKKRTEGYSPLAMKNLARLPAEVKLVSPKKARWDADVVVDGVFGTGFHGELGKEVREIFHRANRSGGTRVALDIPSGLDCDTGASSPDTFRARLTLTFGAYKPALLMEQAAEFVGEVKCLDIGM